MKKIFTVLFMFCAFLMNAQVMQVSGNQSGMWSGEVHVVGDVVVADDSSLVVEPGTLG